MAFFYCSKNGTRTAGGGDPVKRTGAFSAMAAGDLYRHPGDAIADAASPVAGDIIVWDNASLDDDLGTNTNVVIPGGVELISADTNNCDQYAPASGLQMNPATNQYFIQAPNNDTRAITHSGISYKIMAHGIFGLEGSVQYSFDQTISGGAGFSFGFGTTDYSCGIYCDTLYTGDPANGNRIRARSFGQNTLLNFTIDANTTNSATVFENWFEGGDTLADGCDFSGITPGTPLVSHYDQVGSSFGSTIVRNSKLYDAWTTVNVEITPTTLTIVESCDSRYQYFQESISGVVDFVTDVYYLTHATLDDNITQGSYEFTTSPTYCTPAQPLLLGHTNGVRVLSATLSTAATTKKVRLRFVTDADDTLDTSDLWVYVGYPDSGANYVRHWVYHRISPLEGGTSLQTETGNWSGAGLGTQYYLDVDMGDPGNGRVVVIPGVSKPDVTVYFSWQLEFVA